MFLRCFTPLKLDEEEVILDCDARIQTPSWIGGPRGPNVKSGHPLRSSRRKPAESELEKDPVTAPLSTPHLPASSRSTLHIGARPLSTPSDGRTADIDIDVTVETRPLSSRRANSRVTTPLIDTVAATGYTATEAADIYEKYKVEPCRARPPPAAKTAAVLASLLNVHFTRDPQSLEKLLSLQALEPAPPSEPCPPAIARVYSKLPVELHPALAGLATLPVELLKAAGVAALVCMLHVSLRLPGATPSMVWRFCTARKYHPENSETFLHAHLKWREHALPVHFPQIESEIEKNKYNIFGRDREGRWVIYITGTRMGKHTYNTVEESVNTLLYGLERLSNDLLAPTEKFCAVFSAYDVTLKNLDIDWAKRVASLLQYNYPERLGLAVVLPTSFIFRSVWRMVKGFFDPLTVNKIQLVAGRRELWQHVSQKELIESLGGEQVERVDKPFIRGSGCSEGVFGCKQCRPEKKGAKKGSKRSNPQR